MIVSSVRAWLDTIWLALVAILVGIGVGYASIGFLMGIDSLHQLLLGESGALLYTHLAEVSRFHLLILPVIGAILVGLIVKYGIPEHRNYGPADVIHAARIGEGYLSIRIGLTSALTSIVSIGSGASVGRYGPAVHLGATLGAWMAQLLRLAQDQRKTLLACGVAGAISASFSAPLAGVVFAHEVILGRFGSRSVVPIVISSVVATTVPKIHETSGALFMLPNLHVVTTWEYFLFALLGIAGGGLAIIFMSLMQKFSQFAQYFSDQLMIRALFGGLVLGLIIVFCPQTFGLGEQVIRDALMLELSCDVLLGLILAKLLATSVSFAAGFSGGVFGPALFIGAMLGTAAGFGVNEFFEATSSPAVYGVAGMGAVISRVIGAPITTILIVFELTGSYSLTTAVMVSVVVGSTVTREFFNRSYFYYQLRERHIEPDESRVEQILRSSPVTTLIESVPVVLAPDTTLNMARIAAINHEVMEVYVIDDYGGLLGQINAARLFKISDKEVLIQPVTNFLTDPPVILDTAMNVLESYAKLQNFRGSSIPVIAHDNSRQFAGVVYESRLICAYLQAVAQSQQEER